MPQQPALPPEFAGRVFHTMIGVNWHADPHLNQPAA